jgi:hypothetical protein
MNLPVRRNQLPVEAEGELSAAEAACSQAERRFVYLLFELPHKHGYRVQAARLAGFGKDSAPNVVNSIAQRLLSSPRIVTLIEEVTRKQLRSDAPAALAAVREIIADPEHRDRLKAAQTILERIEPTMQRIDMCKPRNYKP